MTRARAASAAALCVLAGGLSGGPRERYDIPYSMEVETPHVPWARRLPGGPVRGYFIPSVSRGRDMVELMQRLSLAPTTVTIDRSWDVNCWGIGDFYGHEYRGDRDDFATVYSYVEEDLTGRAEFEVMLVPGLNGWSRMTRKTRDAIRRRIEEGAGLVLLHPFVGDVKGHPFRGDEREGDTRIWEVSPLVGIPDDFVNERGYAVVNEAAIAKARWEKAGRHFITDGVALDLLPEGRVGDRVYTYEPRGEVLIRAGGHPVLAVKTYGRGRVVAFAYVEDGFLPEAVDTIDSRVYWDYWEYQYALLARSLLWAAKRESDLAIESLRAEADAGLEIALRTPAPREVEIAVTGRSEFGPAVRAHRSRHALTAGSNVLAVPASELRPPEGFAGGRQILDVIVRDADGATLEWGSATFEVAKRAAVAGVRTGTDVYRQGDTVSIVARAAGDLAGLRLRVDVRDDLERLVFREEKPTRGETYFFVDLQEFLGRYARVTAELVDGHGAVVDQLRAKPVLVVPRERRSQDYRALMSFEDSPAYLAPVRKSRQHALAIDPGFTWGGEVNNDLHLPRGYFGVYWYDRGPTTPEGMEKAIAEYERTGEFEALAYLTKKELFKRTGDKKFLVRTPSLDDPGVQRLLRSLSRRLAGNKARYNLDYYFVGDEGSLGAYADPVDFCWGPHTLARFREWLKRQYGSLEALNEEWGAAFADWDAVIPLTTDEARESGRFAPWADHRSYMEVSFANAYRTVREGVVEGDPEGHIAVSGTQVTNPWNGCDWYHLDQVIDDFLSYSGGNQWDLHRSFAKPGSAVGFWTGYGRRGVAVQHEIWTAALSNVLHPNLFWSYSVVNPDLTWSKSGRDMGEVFGALRFEGLGRLLAGAERLGDGVAVHYSMPSVHAAGVFGLHPGRGEGAEGSLPADRDGWVRLLGDLGLSFDFVASEQVEQDALRTGRYRVFVMPLSLAVSAKETAALRRFAEDGGIVVADAAAGLMSEHCAWRGSGMLNDLFGIDAPPSERRDPRAHTSGPVSVTSEGASWGLRADDLAGLEAREADVRARGGAALLRIGPAEAAIVRRVGKGWAVYLNRLLDGYADERKKGYGGAADRALLGRLLEHLGVAAPVRISTPAGSPAERVRIARYRFGEGEVVAALVEPADVTSVQGADGVTVYEDAGLGPVARHDLVVRLPRVFHVVNARTGEPFGRTDTVRASVRAGDALVLGLSPEQREVRLSGPTAAARGERVAFTLTASGRGRQLLRCHVFGPAGAFLYEYARNVVLEGGTGTFVLRSALNDPAGLYRVAATDVLTGARAEARVSLE